jgi:hypothetical protein
LDKWKQVLNPIVDSAFTEVSPGIFGEIFEVDMRQIRLDGRVSKDESRFIGMITDMEWFRKYELPEVFENALHTYPSLAAFAGGPEDSPAFSMMYVLARNKQGNIIARIGAHGEHVGQKELGKRSFKVEYSYKDGFGFSLEVVIPNCTEKALIKNIVRSFYQFLVIWILTIIVLVRLEILLKKARSD